MPPIPPMEEDPLQGADQIWKKKSQEALRQAELVPPAHAYSGLRFPLGRSVEVESGKVADAIRNLEGILNRNKVRLRLRQTQRHEKRGEKLRRLKSERWRNQFAASDNDRTLVAKRLVMQDRKLVPSSLKNDQQSGVAICLPVEFQHP
ncbi:hypothetical protein DFP72DRAFT_840105 [Ephemerocybe angulata]|uniref:Uncharacterized protein n=1 Tax=Ephemerocybe angulata TaxID=980116 RepID=A0A8H6MG66_9AGAR|nr:hypothetical protein DFP72DRAFT_840105 [Tulosesus angulatus]